MLYQDAPNANIGDQQAPHVVSKYAPTSVRGSTGSRRHGTYGGWSDWCPSALFSLFTVIGAGVAIGNSLMSLSYHTWKGVQFDNLAAIHERRAANYMPQSEAEGRR
jgi:hypothetical protein